MTDEKLSDCWQTPKWLFDELNKEFDFDVDLTANAENSKCNNFFVDYLNNKLHLNYFSSNLASQKVENYLNNKTCFMNPPYSNPKPFIEKAWEDSKHCKIVCLVKVDPSTQWWATFWNYTQKTKVDMICPTCNGCGKYTWWQGTVGYDENPCDKCNGKGTYSEKIKVLPGPKPGCEVIYFPKRIKFDPPRELVDAGVYYKRGGRWYTTRHVEEYSYRGVKEFSQEIVVSGPTFPTCLLVFDRRDL